MHGATRTPRCSGSFQATRTRVPLCLGGLCLPGPPLDVVVDLMLRLIWIVSIHPRDFLHRYMPTNIVLDRLRTQRELKWGVPAMLPAILYLTVANILTILIDRDGPGWFHLLVLLYIWNAFKSLIMTPVSMVGAVGAGSHC